MSDVAIRVEGLSKQYRLGQRESYKVLREGLTEAMATPFRLLASAVRPSGNGTQAVGASREPEHLWALNDVSFEVKRGEVVGVIGRNGAGKSTLLKLLARVTEPTRGWAEIHGRVGSLLEVGTGFHPELTGRENIFLNGTMLGMSRREIQRKFDDIVTFAEVARFIDTPVKRYSSGMYVRLAFAVAAHMEPEILLVDEVLAVGDAAFQRKCLGKMEDVSKTGRTILFVSHNMGAISRLCRRCLLLSEGSLRTVGETEQVVATYLASTFERTAARDFSEDPAKPVQIRTLRLLNHEGELTTELDVQQPFTTRIEYDVRDASRSFNLAWMLAKADGTRVCESTDRDARAGQFLPHEPGRYVATVQFPGGILNTGTYVIRVGVSARNDRTLDHQYGFQITLHDRGTFVSTLGKQRLGLLLMNLPWDIAAVETAEAIGTL